MQSARRAALSVLASVRAAVGDLDRIAAWATVTGFVQAQPGYAQTTAIINGFSQVLIDVFCPQGLVYGMGFRAAAASVSQVRSLRRSAWVRPDIMRSSIAIARR